MSQVTDQFLIILDNSPSIPDRRDSPAVIGDHDPCRISIRRQIGIIDGRLQFAGRILSKAFLHSIGKAIVIIHVVLCHILISHGFHKFCGRFRQLFLICFA